MKKFILIALFAVVTAFMTVTAIICNNIDKNELLSANIEALTKDETLSDDEYHQPLSGDEYIKGQRFTNWKVYTIVCTAYGNSSDAGEWQYNASLGVYNFTAGVGVGGGSSSSTSYAPFTYYKEVCGAGTGNCFESAPSGHPCNG